MDSEKQPIVLAAGGTGGHIFPAEALAEALLARGECVILITDKRFAHFSRGVFANLETHTIRAGGSGKNLVHKALAAVNIVVGIVQAWKLLRALQPKAVVGFGGYPSFPTMYAAVRMPLKTAIHEQNSVLGRANRLLAARVGLIATSFPITQKIDDKDLTKVKMVGNPVRASIRALSSVPYPELNPDGTMQILVTGGSQGASVFSEIVPAAIALLPSSLRTRIRIDQQCREAELQATRELYAGMGVSANLSAFFTDIPARLAGSHLVIARSGASTIAELAAAGRPAILVPLPTAMDNHQYTNANAFEDAGGGWLMAQSGFTPAALAARLEAFLNLPSSLSKAAANAHQFGRLNAADELADLVIPA